MGLNDIQFTPAALARLFPHSLVETADGPAGKPVVKKENPDHDVTAPSISPAPVNPDLKPEKQQGIETVKTRKAGPVAEPPAIKALGNNKKRILIVVQYPGVAYLPDEELNFLTSMLTACKLSLDDVAVINIMQNPDLKAKTYLSMFQTGIALLLGPDPVSFGLPVSFPYYQVQSVANNTFLYTPPLEERHTNELMKSKLWVSLKRVFQL